jgi:hypothetical protein
MGPMVFKKINSDRYILSILKLFFREWMNEWRENIVISHRTVSTEHISQWQNFCGNSAHGIQAANCDFLNLQIRNSEIIYTQYLRRSRCELYHELRNILRRIKAGIEVAGRQENM